MRKSFICLVVVLAMALGLCVPAAAAYEKTVSINHRAIKIVLNDELIVPCDGEGKTVEPFIMTETGTTYLPLRAIAQALGLYVDWDDATNTVKLISGGRVKTGEGKSGETVGTSNVKVTYRNIRIFLDGEELNLVNRDGVKVEPFILNSNSSVYLPLRIIGEALGLPVHWSGDISTAYLNCSNDTVANRNVERVTLSANDARGRVGDYLRLEAYVEPASAVNKTITWTSTDNDIVRVNAEGMVVLQGKGVAEIVATSENGKSARCKIVVRGDAKEDPFIDELGYSYSEIKYLVDSADAAAKSLVNALSSIDKAENASSMGVIHAAAAISHVEKAADQLSTALAITKNGLPLKLSEGKYATVADLVEAAQSPLNEVINLKVGNENMKPVLAMLTDAIVAAQPIVSDFQKASSDVLVLFEDLLEDEEDEETEDDGKLEMGDVIIDKDGIKVTAVEFKNDVDLGELADYFSQLQLKVENNSGKTLLFVAQRLYVDGKEMAVDGDREVTMAHGKSELINLKIANTGLESAGIEEINEIDLTLAFFDPSASMATPEYTYMEGESLTIHIEDNKTEEEDKTDEEEDKEEEKQEAELGSVILDEAGVKITAKEFVPDGTLGAELKLYIENSSGKDLEIQCRDAVVNEYMVETTMSAAVLNGKKANDKLIFDKASLEENNIEEIKTIEFSFHIFEKDKYDTSYLDSKTICIAVEDESADDSVSDIIGGIVDGSVSEDLEDILGQLGNLTNGSAQGKG